jgi:hypothetical protein
LKEAVRNDQKEACSPFPFWDYCFERRARINNVTSRDLFQLRGERPKFKSPNIAISNDCVGVLLQSNQGLFETLAELLLRFAGFPAFALAASGMYYTKLQADQTKIQAEQATLKSQSYWIDRGVE